MPAACGEGVNNLTKGKPYQDNKAPAFEPVYKWEPEPIKKKGRAKENPEEFSLVDVPDAAYMSAREKSVFSFIIHYKNTRDGNAPTIREIVKACEVSSTSVAKYYLLKLEERELISLHGGARTIQVVGGYQHYGVENEPK